MRINLWVALIIAASLLSRPAVASVPERRRAQVIIKALSYDRNIKTRAGDPVMIVVLTNGSGCEDIFAALQSAANSKRVGGRRVQIANRPWSEDLAKSMATEKVGAVFICPGLTAELPNIVKMTRQHHILSFTGSEEDVRAGISVGIVQRGSRANLMVNMAAVKKEGVDLDSSFMRVAGAIR